MEHLPGGQTDRDPALRRLRSVVSAAPREAAPLSASPPQKLTIRARLAAHEMDSGPASHQRRLEARYGLARISKGRGPSPHRTMPVTLVSV